MSRLIVKNLPNGIKEERLRKHFGGVGPVTDCSLKYAKDGSFRKFAFVGFKTDTEAHSAISQFNKTFIDTSKIQIELAKDFGDSNKPRAWSKYAKDSSAGQKNSSKDPEVDSEKVSGKKKKKKKKTDNKVVEELLDDLKDDPKFMEFLDAHKNVSTKPVWTNDNMAAVDETGSGPQEDMQDKMEEREVEGEAEDQNNNEENDSDSDSLPEEEANKLASQKKLSDLDYLKAKMSGTEESKAGDAGPVDEDKKVAAEAIKSEKPKAFMLRLKGLPVKSGEKAVREFFTPLKIVRMRIPKSAGNKAMGVAYVGFKTEKDLDQALRRNKTFIGGKRVFLKAAETEQVDVAEEAEKLRPWQLKEHDNTETEGIGESGRMFVRNLAFSCTEEDLEATFSKFGPLTEVHLPVDSLTKKIKGFAFITYMMPEHAVKAFSQMDGKVFQGRMLHILPGKEKKKDTEVIAEGSSYKTKKQAKQKAAANSSHNWNALFLGANAVADVLAEKYETSKSDVLDHELKGSLGVRMALGETQVVQETREFLTEHGVALDSFSQPSAARSKTAILVKNLPARTEASELEAVFSPYGDLGRLVIPPTGVTAIVEFIAPTEARAAFTKLAYRRFRHVPLFLEWAPMEVFTSPVPPANQSASKLSTSDVEMKDVSDTTASSQAESKATGAVEEEEEEEEVASVLFVKNLNFASTDETMKEHFSECKNMKSASVATKKDMKNPGHVLSMGYGFVEFTSPDGAQHAMKNMQHSQLDGHQLDLKISNRTTASSSSNQTGSNKKKQKDKKQNTTKILVRNIPFEAKRHEVEELFKVFGELKFVRLPKKMASTGHRGFGFVDFLTKHDAKRAFEALCQSTHLYGRRLVLEWAQAAEDIDDIRKRTADHFFDEQGGGKKFTKAGLTESLENSLAD